MKTVQFDFKAMQLRGSSISELHLIVQIDIELTDKIPVVIGPNAVSITFAKDYDNITKKETEVPEYVDYEDVFGIKLISHQLLVWLKPSKVLDGWFLCYMQRV